MLTIGFTGVTVAFPKSEYVLKLVTSAHAILLVVSTPVFGNVIQSLFVASFHLYIFSVVSSIPAFCISSSEYVMVMRAFFMFVFIIGSTIISIVLFAVIVCSGALFLVFCSCVAIFIFASTVSVFSLDVIVISVFGFTTIFLDSDLVNVILVFNKLFPHPPGPMLSQSSGMLHGVENPLHSSVCLFLAYVTT